MKLVKTAKIGQEVPGETDSSCIKIPTEECCPNSLTATVVLPDDQKILADLVDLDSESDGRNLFHNTQNPQALCTGRLGERVAYNYFSENAGRNIVKWVNQDIESGLPYDLVIEDEQKNVEFIEVKATKSSDKDWFHITLKEWEFAVEKGESFSIVHVTLTDTGKITVYKNPVKLCQLGKLHLALLMP